MVVHQIHCLDEVAVERDEHGIIGGKLIEAVEVMRVRYFIVTQRAERAFDHVIETEIGARGEVRRKNAVVASGHEDGGRAMQVARRNDLLDALTDAARLACWRPGEWLSGDGVFAGRERAKARRAVGVLVRW